MSPGARPPDNRRRDRYRGALLGLAAGDALGTTLEFAPRDSYVPLDDMVGGGPFGLRPGEWTDDTAMALCLAESLIEAGGFDAQDQMRRYVRWWREGCGSVNGVCFDIGTTVAASLHRFERSGNPFAGRDDPKTAGNGSLMRIGPVPLFYARDFSTAIVRAAESSRTTHGALEAVDACRLVAALIVLALDDAAKQDVLSPSIAGRIASAAGEPLVESIAAVANGSYRRKKRHEIHATGYVLHSLEAALWAFASTETFRDGALLAVNLGEDADTTGAIYGQIAGAFYGAEAIPAPWRRRLAHRERIEALSDRLFECAES